MLSVVTPAPSAAHITLTHSCLMRGCWLSNLAMGTGRTQVDAQRHGAQRVRRRGQAAGDLHGAQLAPEVRAIVLHYVPHLPDQILDVCRLATCTVTEMTK